ncbi:hypothetical protein V5N11_018346 [Cardamine amara subsp. amara]|uniref:Endonuclease/exonuclease/phosphatase domain-containing protein n=1 Tax=Cardamine amara subsp. amara TaxID=228776 RepID=A0ABD0ZZL1_CARAN
MSCFFWNIRGLNKKNKQKVIRDWIRSNSFQFGCLLETKLKQNRAESVASSVFQDWSMVSNYESHRFGRIWVVWSKHTRVKVEFKSGQMITCLVKIQNFDVEFLCSFVYASNSAAERKELWRDIKSQHDLALFRGKPWIVMGDYNETLDLDEHSNSDTSPQITSGMVDFQDVVWYCSLKDLKTHGPIFTWCNKREEDLVCKKLDRVLQNVVWYQSFPQAYCVIEAGGCSDHLRGKIFLSSDIQKPKGPFKFANAISSQPEFVQTVEDY